MAISAKMLQYRGTYANFRPSLLLPGQFAVVLSGDPNTTTGRAVYMCFSAGTATRILADGDVVSGEVSDEKIAQAVADYLAKNPLPSGGGFVAQAEPPTDTSKLWIDTDDDTSEDLPSQEVDLSNYYTKNEIDAIMGSYINDIDALVGGDTADSVKPKIQGLIDTANAKTGGSDTDLTSAVGKLVDGYGSGGSEEVFSLTSKAVGIVPIYEKSQAVSVCDLITLGLSTSARLKGE